MEDAAEAIKMSFAVFIFIIAMGTAFIMFSQSRRVADLIIASNDKTYVETYSDAALVDNGRIVGVENLLPTLYRYYKQRYSVDIKGNDNQVKVAFDLEAEQKHYNQIVDYKKDSPYIRDGTTNYRTLYPSGIHWLGSSPNRDSKLRVDNFASGQQQGRKINNEVVKHQIYLNFNDTYIRTFEDNYTGKKVSTVRFDDPDYDGTYLIVDENGETKLHITYKKQ